MFRYGKETAVFAIIVFAAIAIAILLVADNKDNPVLLVLFILFVTTLFWIVKPFGISIGGTSCLLLALFMLLGIPNEIVFSGFMESSVWTMIPALFFGYALKKTGLGRRLVSYVLGHIGSLSYFKLIAAWFVIGVILSLLTPSITVRVIIVIPLAMETVDLCGIPKNSKGRSLILLSAWSMSVIPGIGWYTGSLLGPVISGIFSSVPEIPAITPSKWLSICLLPTAIVTVLLLIMSYFFLKPDSNLKKINNPFKTSKYPKISFDEKSSLIILLAAFTMMATERIHGLSSTVICMLGFVLLCITGVLNEKDISEGISWDMVLFIGASLCFEAVFEYCGVTDWLSHMLYPFISIFAEHEILLVLSVTIFLFIWHFVDVALLTPTLIVFAAIVPMIQHVCGISSLVWIPIFSFAICSFFLPYQNMFLMIGESECGKTGWMTEHRLIYACVYCIVSIVTVFCMIPYWRCLGLFP